MLCFGYHLLGGLDPSVGDVGAPFVLDGASKGTVTPAIPPLASKPAAGSLHLPKTSGAWHFSLPSLVTLHLFGC